MINNQMPNSKQIPIFKFQFSNYLVFGAWNLIFIWCLVLGAWNFLACSSSKPAWEYMPDMADQPSFKAGKYDPQAPHHRSLREPVKGTIPRGYQPYPYKEDPEGAGRNLKNPLLPRTEAVLGAGQKTFNTYCFVCHGTKGLGDGPIVPKFPKPPSLQSEKVRGWSDGRIYHVITMGQNLMPSYASQVSAEERWAAIHYIRALQKSQNPTPQDVEAYKKERRNPKH